MKKFTIICTLMLTAFAANSNAQFIGGVGSTWNNPVSAQISSSLWNSINQKMAIAPSLRKMGCTQAQINKMTLSQAQNALAKKTCTTGGADRMHRRAEELHPHRPQDHLLQGRRRRQQALLNNIQANGYAYSERS